MLNSYRLPCLWVLFLGAAVSTAQQPDSLPILDNGVAPQNFEQMWAGFDPCAEPLETETLKEWEEDGVVLRVVRFRIGVFKGVKAKLAAIYGFPKSKRQARRPEQTQFPGLVQIHGGGQYADHKACLANAKRGYATLSLAWAGRISAPAYRVSPAEVKLFWDGATDDPNYRLTTDWGAVDGYHAPGRNQGNVFPSAKPAAWTLDPIESPRNSGWFLCALAARRALTFLEQQPEVDASRLGVYGHSMGGKLTVMTAVDPRAKAAAPSCGGISDRDNASELFRATIGDNVSLSHIACPIIFLSPANDFHGRIGDLPNAIKEIKSQQWRVTCSPHHNHQDTPPYEVATMLWMDQHLKGTFQFPRTPKTRLSLDTSDGVPVLTVRPDDAMTIASVDVFYTQQGKADETPQNRLETMHRYWHHAPTNHSEGAWRAKLPIRTTEKPLWVYANIKYPLAEPVAGAGYYYGSYLADSFNISSLLEMASPQELATSNVRATMKPSLLLENFRGDWEKSWFRYRSDQWTMMTNRLNALDAEAPAQANLSIQVRAVKPNKLVLLLDEYATVVNIAGDNQWQTLQFKPSDFVDYDDQPLGRWNDVRQLKLSPAEHLRPGRGQSGQPKLIGAHWKGTPPQFAQLRWVVD